MRSETMLQAEAKTYLTAKELSERIKYKPNVIDNILKDAVLIEGIHYIRPFGRRRVLYLWEAIEQTMLAGAETSASPLTLMG
jgi:hypothetical protein